MKIWSGHTCAKSACTKYSSVPCTKCSAFDDVLAGRIQKGLHAVISCMFCKRQRAFCSNAFLDKCVLKPSYKRHQVFQLKLFYLIRQILASIVPFHAARCSFSSVVHFQMYIGNFDQPSFVPVKGRVFK